MILEDLIKALAAADQRLILPDGFHRPHSHRADYSDLAFEPAQDISVADMLAAAKSADGATFEGWKGGDYEMDGDSDCYIAERGTCGEPITGRLLKYMLTPVSPHVVAVEFHPADLVAGVCDTPLINGVRIKASTSDRRAWLDLNAKQAKQLVTDLLAAGFDPTCPAEWPPQVGDLWQGHDGNMWFCQSVPDFTANETHLLLMPARAGQTRITSFAPDTVNDQAGPLALVYRDQQDGGTR